MRHIDKKHFTKAERVFARLLDEMRIDYQTKVIIEGREIDFVVGKAAVDINGHEQDESKNSMLIDQGYVPLHFHNSEVLSRGNSIIEIIKKHAHTS